jgi:hypothetical protein
MKTLRDLLQWTLVTALGLSLVSCGEPLDVKGKVQEHPSQSKSGKPLLEGIKPLGSINLVNESGLPVKVLYYNLQSDFALVVYRLAEQFPTSKGWKHNKADDMAVFTSNNPNPEVKWQRIAVFKGRLDEKYKIIPKTDDEWVNVAVYRVMNQ